MKQVIKAFTLLFLLYGVPANPMHHAILNAIANVPSSGSSKGSVTTTTTTATKTTSATATAVDMNLKFLDTVMGAFKDAWKEMNYDNREVYLRLPPLNPLGLDLSNYALVWDTGFKRAGTVFDGPFPQSRIDIRSMKSPEQALAVKAGLELFSMLGAGQQGVDAFKAQLGGAKEKPATGIEGMLSTFTNFFAGMSQQDYIELTFIYKLFTLLKSTTQRELLRAGKGKIDLNFQSSKIMELLCEIGVLTFRRYLSVEKAKFDHQHALSNAPEWVLETLQNISIHFGKDKEYFKNLFEEIWGSIWRYQRFDFDSQGNIQGIGPSVYGVSFTTAAEAQKYLETMQKNFLPVMKLGIREFSKSILEFCDAQMQTVAPDSQQYRYWSELKLKIETGSNYQYFGLVDQTSPEVNKNIQDAALLAKHGAEPLPVFRQAQAPGANGKPAFWVLYVTPTLNFTETAKLSFAIALKAALACLQAEKQALLDPYFSAAKKRALAAEDEQALQDKNAELYLKQTTGGVALLAKKSIEVDEKIAKLKKPYEKIGTSGQPNTGFTRPSDWTKVLAEDVIKTRDQLKAEVDALPNRIEELDKARKKLRIFVFIMERLGVKLDSIKADNIQAGGTNTVDLLKVFIVSKLRSVIEQKIDEQISRTLSSVWKRVDDKTGAPTITDEEINKVAKALGYEQMPDLHTKNPGEADSYERALLEVFQTAQDEYRAVEDEYSVKRNELDVKKAEFDRMPKPAFGAKTKAAVKSITVTWVLGPDQARSAVEELNNDYTSLKEAYEDLEREERQIAVARIPETEKVNKKREIDVKIRELLTLMLEKAVYMAENAEVALSEMDKLYRVDVDQLKGKSEKDFKSKLEWLMVDARHKQSKHNLDELSKTKSQLKKKISDAKREKHSSHDKLITALDLLVAFAAEVVEFDLLATSPFAKMRKETGEYFKKLRERKDFKMIKEDVLKRTEAVLRNSVTRQFITIEMTIFKIFLGPVLDITDADIERLSIATEAGPQAAAAAA